VAGLKIKQGGEYIAEIEKKMTESTRIAGQKRSRELQAEVEANKSRLHIK